MKTNYFTVHKNKKTKKAKYSKPYSRLQLQKMEECTLYFVSESMKRIQLNNGTARVNTDCSEKTIDALKIMADKFYNLK